MSHFEHMHAATALRQRMLQEDSVPALVVAAPEPHEVMTLDPKEPHPGQAAVIGETAEGKPILEEHSAPPEEPTPTILGVPVTPAPPHDENAPPAI